MPSLSPRWRFLSRHGPRSQQLACSWTSAVGMDFTVSSWHAVWHGPQSKALRTTVSSAWTSIYSSGEVIWQASDSSLTKELHGSNKHSQQSAWTSQSAVGTQSAWTIYSSTMHSQQSAWTHSQQSARSPAWTLIYRYEAQSAVGTDLTPNMTSSSAVSMDFYPQKRQWRHKSHWSASSLQFGPHRTFFMS